MNEFDLIVRFRSNEDSITLRSYIIDHLFEDKLFNNLQMWDFRRSDVLSLVNLQKENAELKSQIKLIESVSDANADLIQKMKCCGNCTHCYEEKYDGLCCDLFDGVKYIPSVEKRDCDKWECKK